MSAKATGELMDLMPNQSDNEGRNIYVYMGENEQSKEALSIAYGVSSEAIMLHIRAAVV